MYKSQQRSKRIPELERAALKDVFVEHPQVQCRPTQKGPHAPPNSFIRFVCARIEERTRDACRHRCRDGKTSG